MVTPLNRSFLPLNNTPPESVDWSSLSDDESLSEEVHSESHVPPENSAQAAASYSDLSISRRVPSSGQPLYSRALSSLKRIGKSILDPLEEGIHSIKQTLVKTFTPDTRDSLAFERHIQSFFPKAADVQVTKNPCPENVRCPSDCIPDYQFIPTPSLDNIQQHTNEEVDTLVQISSHFVSAQFLYYSLYNKTPNAVDNNLLWKIAAEAACKNHEGEYPDFRSVFTRHLKVKWYLQPSLLILNLLFSWIPQHFLRRVATDNLRDYREHYCSEAQAAPIEMLKKNGIALNTYFNDFQNAFNDWAKNPRQSSKEFINYLTETTHAYRSTPEVRVDFQNRFTEFISSRIPPLDLRERIFEIFTLRLWHPKSLVFRAFKKLYQALFTIPLYAISWIFSPFSSLYNRTIHNFAVKGLRDSVGTLLNNCKLFFESKDYTHIINAQLLYQLSALKETLREQLENLKEAIEEGGHLPPAELVPAPAVSMNIELNEILCTLGENLLHSLPLAGCPSRDAAETLASRGKVDGSYLKIANPLPLSFSELFKTNWSKLNKESLSASTAHYVDGALEKSIPFLVNSLVSLLTPDQFEYLLYTSLKSINESLSPLEPLSPEQVFAKQQEYDTTAVQLERMLEDVSATLIDLLIYQYHHDSERSPLMNSLIPFMVNEDPLLTPSIKQSIIYLFKKNYLIGAYKLVTDPRIMDNLLYMGLNSLLPSPSTAPGTQP